MQQSKARERDGDAVDGVCRSCTCIMSDVVNVVIDGGAAAQGVRAPGHPTGMTHKNTSKNLPLRELNPGLDGDSVGY